MDPRQASRAADVRGLDRQLNGPLASVIAVRTRPSCRLGTSLYLEARERNPARWSGTTRDWTPIGAVTLNPERDSVVADHLKEDDKRPLSA